MIIFTLIRMDDAFAAPLVRALDEELWARYPETHGAATTHAPARYMAPHGAFVIALVSGKPCACGAFEIVEPGLGEVHRMFVAPSARRRGLGHAVLGELERLARAMYCTRMRLETGLRQPEAIALYERAGYERVPCFEPFVNDPLSLCFGKTLVC